jgi:ankyrin repeat protein
MNALIELAEESKIQKIKEMLKSGLFDLNKIEDNGFLGGATYLDTQLKTGSKDFCNFLIKNGAKTSLEIHKIFNFVFSHDVNEIKKVIKSKIDANLIDEEGESILCTASRFRNIEIIKHLIENGADVNFKNKTFGFTPLMKASNSANLDGIKILLENGADVNAKSTYGSTALDRIVDKSDISEERKNKIISLLLKYGAKM